MASSDRGCKRALAPPDDASAFADAVERVLGDLESLAREAAAHAPTWDHVVEAVVELMRDPRES